jgi:hypothetical protein
MTKPMKPIAHEQGQPPWFFRQEHLGLGLTKYVEHKADEPMILRKGQKVGVDKDDVLCAKEAVA